MVECYHPDLESVEINALSTLFAAKDRFTVTDLSLAPWGYDDETLAWAIKSGAVTDLDFWKTLDYKTTRQTTTTSVRALEKSRAGKSKLKTRVGRRGGRGGGGGFGKP